MTLTDIVVLAFLVAFAVWAFAQVSQHSAIEDSSIDAGIKRILSAIKEERERVSKEIEAARWQVDVLNQSFEGDRERVLDRLDKMLEQYDKLLAIVTAMDERSKNP